MATNEPVTERNPHYRSANVSPTPWSAAIEVLEQAKLFWISTMSRYVSPNVTPLIAIWMDDALYFSTGASERKARNLEFNARCATTTDCNTLDEGLDLVIEGVALRLTAEAKRRAAAARYVSEYDWRYTVVDGAFRGDEGNIALVYEVRPTTLFAFDKGEQFSQTRWRF